MKRNQTVGRMVNRMRPTMLCMRLWIFCASLIGGAAQQPATSDLPIYKQPQAPIEARIDDLVHRMTLAEKVRQLDLYAGAKDLVNAHTDDTHAAPTAAFIPAKAQALFGSLGVGGVHDLYPTPTQANAIQKWIIEHNRLGIPALFIEEGLHGYDTGTVFPAPIGLSATWDVELAQETATSIASEARAHGVDMILAPVLDLAREPRWGRVEEDFGEDPYLTGQLGLAYVRGAQGTSLQSDESVIAEPKHFAGHGSPEGGTNTSPVHMGERELRSVMLKGFEPAFRDGHAMATMAAYHEIDGIPVTADPFLLKKVLRDEWGFQGFVLSDLGAIERLYTVHHVAATPKDAVCMAIRSGVDMQFYDFAHDVFQQALIDCVHENTLSEMDLDRAVRSILRVKFKLGLFDRPFVDTDLVDRTYRSQPHLAVSLRSARESMTLLKNDKGLLPLSKSIASIAVIGPNTNVARYGDYEKKENGLHVSLLDGLRKEVPKARIDFDDGKDIASAVNKAREADVVILGLGEHQGISGEGFDRSSLDLPDSQEKLLEAIVATGRLVVLVLENGRPLTLPWAKEHVPAILEAWYPGEFGGQAIAETLFGDNNPAGRLSVSFPGTVGQLPDFYNTDPSRKVKYVDDDGEALFLFGFGLSYTTFGYAHLMAQAPPAGSHDPVRVSVEVTNTGEREGEEVAQLYVRQDTSSVETPVRSLKGFSRIHLKPHETRTVSFDIPQSELAIWNAEGKWITEPGKFTVWAGGNSRAELTANFTLNPND
jgi:beta-glucosidase